MENGFYKELTNQYSVQKMLRWELKPVGETRKHIEQKQLIETDEQMAESYKIIKKMIDQLHKKVIEESLDKGSLFEELFKSYYLAVRVGNEVEQERIEDMLRKEVSEILSSHPMYKTLFGKDVVVKELPKFAKTQDELDVIESFSKFASALQNYHEIRRNLYTSEKRSSSVAYRLIHENLPKFIDNIRIYEKLCCYDIDFYSVITELEPYFGDIDLGKVFQIKSFNDVLTQKGIDVYNQIIGGVATENGKIKGLNEVINLWNQQHPKEKLPKFMQLYKQMLGEGETKSFVIDKFETDQDVITALRESIPLLQEVIDGSSTKNTVTDLYRNLPDYDMDGIFVKTENLSEISNIVFGKWDALRKCISLAYDKTYNGKKKPGTVAYDTEKEKQLKAKGSYSLNELQTLSDVYMENGKNIAKALCERAYEIEIKSKNATKELSIALEYKVKEDKSLKKNAQLVEIIKGYLDSVKEMQAYLRLWQGTKKQEADERFYSDHAEIWDKLFVFNSLYNKVRNYITKKPYSTDKIKLNFWTPSLLNGWDVNKESDNLGVLLQKDGLYYLGIMDKENRKSFKSCPIEDENGLYYEKIDYKLLPGPNKMFPKVFFAASRIEEFAPSEEILRIYQTGTFKTGAMFSLSDCHKLIDFYKESIEKHEEWRKFDFKFAPTEEYNNIHEFYRDVEEQGYKLTKRNVPASYIEQLVSEGQLYLFQIYSKDFSKNSKGKPNLQYIYWNMLFDERNTKGNVIYKLNGEAEIFYRKPSLALEETAVHKKGEKLISKNPLNPVREKTAEWDIVKDRRYTQEKFLFHVSITLNFVSKDVRQLNTVVNEHIKKLDEYYVIGINRGERNLLYAVVINHKGEIVNSQQLPLNVITNTYNNGSVRQQIDYRRILDEREKERDNERKSWAPIEQIKNIKTGYLSQAIHVITQLAVKYNAFIAIENLDADFVRSRKKIEKQIYQNFERMLIQKLSYLVVDKDRAMQNVCLPGGALAAYQLTNEFVSFSKLGNQNGIIFRLPPGNVTHTDPVTGFVNFLYPTYDTMKNAKIFFDKFEGIRYNLKKDYFEFVFDYSDFTSKAEDTKTKWTVCTYGKRLKTFKNPEKQNKWDVEHYYPTQKMKELLDDNNISYVHGNCLKKDILSKTDAAFFKELMEILKLTLQMRNTGLSTEAEDAFIQSCVANERGEFFNSIIASEKLPRSVDANGAYNIARKALILIEKIRQSKENEKVKLSVSCKEWLQFAQK